MEMQWWVVLTVLVIVVAIIGYRRFRQTREIADRDRRMGIQAQGAARSAGEEISQREDRRLAGMTAEDRDWEQASLERNREFEHERARRAKIVADQP